MCAEGVAKRRRPAIGDRDTRPVLRGAPGAFLDDMGVAKRRLPAIGDRGMRSVLRGAPGVFLEEGLREGVVCVILTCFAVLF